MMSGLLHSPVECISSSRHLINRELRESALLSIQSPTLGTRHDVTPVDEQTLKILVCEMDSDQIKRDVTHQLVCFVHHKEQTHPVRVLSFYYKGINMNERERSSTHVRVTFLSFSV